MKKLGMKLIGLVLLITTIFLTPCSAFASDVTSNEPTKGFIWEATNGDDSIYLVGTMHPAPNNVNFFNDKINNIIKETDGIATEIDLTDEKNIKELQEYIANNFRLQNGEIRDFLTGDEEKILYNILSDYKLSYNDISKLNSNGVISALGSQNYALNGFTGPMFDVLLQKKYKELNKEVISLEDTNIQMNALSSDINSLKQYIKTYNKNSVQETNKYMNKLFQGYATGDFNIGEEAIKAHQMDKESYKKLLVDRNIGMADKIEKLSKNNKKYMVAVGYLHYFGEDSVIKLLEKKGYTVKSMN